MPDLIAATTHLHKAWIDAHAEWGPGVHEDGFGLLPTDDVESPAGFEAWVSRLADDEVPTLGAAGRTRCTYRWIVEGDQILGGIALRHDSNEIVRRAGHIGYGIRPSARRRGLATWALGRMINEARLLGVVRLLVVCEVGNVASATTIVHHGGVQEEPRDNEPAVAWRYWINIGESGG